MQWPSLEPLESIPHLPIYLISITTFTLIIGLCILLRVYQSNIGRPPYATQYFSARFYCALITLHVAYGGLPIFD
jgi:hypothetical protein